MTGPRPEPRTPPKALVTTVVVDADGHVVEPPEAWSDVPEEARPRIVADSVGIEHVIVGDTEILAVPLGTLATPGSSFADFASYAPLSEAHQGGSDPHLRLIDMDAEGIDQAVLFPSIGLYFSAVADPDSAVHLARAYNDWLASYCAADRLRLFGAAMLPLQDPVAAAAELRRAANELHFPAAFVRPNPCGGRSLSDPAYEVVWSAAEEVGVPVCVHEGSSVIVPTLGSDRPFNPLILHAVSHSFEQMLACAQLIAFGVLERHRDLQVVFLESSGGWVPFWLERLDEQAETFGGFCPDMVERPSDYFARQCFISYEIDEATLPALLPFIGEDRVVWGSDYPHHDATFPGAVDALRSTLAPLLPRAQAKVLGLNARGLYGLPSRHSGPAAVVHAYFTAVTTRDPDALRRLFTPDARLVTGGITLVGAADIVSFYATGAFIFDDLLPRPGALDIDGARVEVTIELHVGGTDSSIVDQFTVAGNQISRLEISALPSVLQFDRP
jgi:predicted TIM-barrel fold metal-dependent hydrolase